MSESSNKPFSSAIIRPKPVLGSSFRIDDILVKNEPSCSKQNLSLPSKNSLPNNESNWLSEKFSDLTNESTRNSKKIAKTCEKEGKHHVTDDTNLQHNPAKLLMTLSSIYDMHNYYPGINALIKNGLNNNNLQSFYSNLTNDDPSNTALAFSNNVNTKHQNGLFTNSSNTSPMSILFSSNGCPSDSPNNKFNSIDIPTNKLEVKNPIKLCRRRKARTVFSDQQLSGLEKRFESQKYLSTPERVELANNLGLSETQVY